MHRVCREFKALGPNNLYVRQNEDISWSVTTISYFNISFLLDVRIFDL